MFSLLSLIRSPVLQIMIAITFAATGLWTYRSQVREAAKNEVVQKITTQEIHKLQKTTNAQDRIRRDHLRSPDRLREHNDGYRRD